MFRISTSIRFVDSEIGAGTHLRGRELAIPDDGHVYFGYRLRPSVRGPGLDVGMVGGRMPAGMHAGRGLTLEVNRAATG